MMARAYQASCAVALAFIVSIAGVTSADAPQAPAKGLPKWWKADVAFMSEGGGTWLAPNSPGEKDPGLPDAFGMEWHSANEGHLLIGRH